MREQRRSVLRNALSSRYVELITVGYGCRRSAWGPAAWRWREGRCRADTLAGRRLLVDRTRPSCRVLPLRARTAYSPSLCKPETWFRASSLHRTRIGSTQTATTRAEGRGRMGMRVTDQGSRRSGHGQQHAAQRTGGGAGSESLPSRSTYRHTRFGEGSACSPNPGLPIDLYAYGWALMPTCRTFCLLSI